MHKLNGRREFINRYFIAGLALFGIGSLVQCNSDKGTSDLPKSDNPCEDLSEVGKKDLDIRKKAAYVPVSPMPEKICGNCNLFIPPKESSTCGACLLFKGPVETKGFCIYWAPHTT